MITIEIPERKLTLNLPEHLGECSSKEYVLMCRLFFQYQSGELDYHQFRMTAVYHLLNLVPGESKLTTQENENKKGNLFKLSELIDSFFKEQNDKLLIRQEYQHNPIPVIDCGLVKYYGPADYFKDVKFGQYVDALQIFGTFQETADIELLYHLCAIFYKRKGKEYDANEVEKIVSHLKKTEFGFTYGFYMLFASFQHYLTSARIYYQGKEIDLSILFKSTGENTSPSGLASIGMKSTAYDLAESGILGNLKDVNRTDMWEAFFLMYEIMRKDKDHKIRSKQKK